MGLTRVAVRCQLSANPCYMADCTKLLECQYVRKARDNSRSRQYRDGILYSYVKTKDTDMCMGTKTEEPLREGNSLPEDDAIRGLYPMADGCLDYFPNALAEVSRISYEGNLKHNPGEPMGWARAKSTDHRNKIIRHTVDSRPDTEAAIEHAAQAAWRALAHLQTKIEVVRGIRQSAASK